MSAEPTDLFERVYGTLEIELSEPTVPIGSSANQMAPPSARLVGLRLVVEIEDEGSEEPRPLREDELGAPAFAAPRIRLRAESDDIVDHDAPDGEGFTVGQLIAAIEATERQTRGDSEWFGGVDAHHVYYEGLEPDEEEDGVWQICWGS